MDVKLADQFVGMYVNHWTLDYGDRDQFLDCFTPDAHYEVAMRIDSSSGFAFDGHVELTGYFDGHSHASVSTMDVVIADYRRALLLAEEASATPQCSQAGARH